MGGGQISKDRMICHGKPKNTVEMNWLCGGSFPGWKEGFKYLEEINVKLIVTLTIEPIKIGRNINHQPIAYDDTEWCDSDLEEQDLSRFNIVHIPIADGGVPTDVNIEKLLLLVKEFRNTYPTSKAYFHCWLGRGRTCTILMYLLMHLNNMTYDDAYQQLQNQYSLIKLSPVQIKFLKNIPLTDEEIIQSQPIIKTPADSWCYDYLKKKL